MSLQTHPCSRPTANPLGLWLALTSSSSVRTSSASASALRRLEPLTASCSEELRTNCGGSETESRASLRVRVELLIFENWSCPPPNTHPHTHASVRVSRIMPRVARYAPDVQITPE